MTSHINYFHDLFFLFTEYTQIGCFRVDSGPLIPSLEHNDPLLDGDFAVRTQSIGKCLNAARRQGNKMFAFKNGGECLSSADGHLDVTTKYEESDDCVNKEGGAYAMNVFLLKGYILCLLFKK